MPGLTGAVLLAAVNIFTPLTSALFGANAKEREVGASTWLSCVVALAASTFALLPEGAGFELPAIGVGESEVLAAAFFFSAAKVRQAEWVSCCCALANPPPPPRFGSRRISSCTTQTRARLADWWGRRASPRPDWGCLTRRTR